MFLAEKRKRRILDEFNLYQELKDSLVTTHPPNLDTSFPAQIPELLGQLNLFVLNLSSHKQSTVFIACLIGRNLSAIRDMFCNQVIAGNFIDVVQQVLPKKGYSQSQIYFLIKLFKLVEKFNKLQYVSISVTKFKNNYKFLNKKIEQEADFWRQ